MMLECPNCATRFNVPPQALGDVGRTVRCSQCSFEWFAEPRDLIDPAATDESAENTAEEGAMDEAELEEFGEDILSVLDAIDTTEDADDNTESAPASDTTPKLKGPPLLPAVAALAASLVILIAGGIAYFHEPLRTMGLSPVYTALGMEESAEVKLADLKLSKAVGAKRTTYAIRGMVINTTEQEQPIPMVRIRLVGQEGDVLRGWEYQQDGVMKPKEVLPFSADRLDSAFQASAHAFIVDIGSGFEIMLRD